MCLYLLYVKLLCLRTRQLRYAAHGVGFAVHAHAAVVRAAARTRAMHVAFCCVLLRLCFGFFLGVRGDSTLKSTRT